MTRPRSQSDLPPEREPEPPAKADERFGSPERFPLGTNTDGRAVGADTPSPASFSRDLVTLEEAFERALRSMTMNFQPIVEARHHHLFGYEALLRPNDPELPHPGAMLDAAERLNRLDKLGRAIRIRVAQRCATAAPERGLFFVNLHALDLLDKALSSPYSPLAKARDRIVLEVTERASLDGLADVRYRVAELREMGYRIAIDDLGAGHARMKKFTPLDTDFVKLDMSLIRDIDRHAIKRQLVASIGDLCHEQGIRVIAEGVETEAEREALLEVGCELLQGYLIARPAPELADIEPVP